MAVAAAVVVVVAAAERRRRGEMEMEDFGPSLCFFV